MSRIINHILAIFALMTVACSGSTPEPGTAIVTDEGNISIAFHAVENRRSRAQIQLNGNDYDLYCCGVVYNTPFDVNGYYTQDYHNLPIYVKMAYDESLSLFYTPTHFYPFAGIMDLLSYGCAKGKNVTPTALPLKLNKNQSADYMMLDLTQGYDGSFDIIAADRLTVPLNNELSPEKLPYAHYHHIMASIEIKVKWADVVPSNADILNRLFINNITIANTSCQGKFHMRNTMADVFWEDLGKEVVLENTAANKWIPYEGGATIGRKYIVPTTSRQKFIVNYTLRNGDNENCTLNYVVQDDPTEGWLAGHKYTYTITIGEHASITISDVAVEPFAPGNVGPTVIE